MQSHNDVSPKLNMELNFRRESYAQHHVRRCRRLPRQYTDEHVYVTSHILMSNLKL
jgi:hypothetical protein